ncbi:MAG: nuclear transport factor 2 family protein [Syntrophales bacterium]
MLTAKEIRSALARWYAAWNAHDLDRVMELFHEDAVFENWTGGKAQGKKAIHQAWDPWFKNHGGFRFTEEDTFIDEGNQKVLFQWTLDWPSGEKGYRGRPERRRGVDVMHFKDGKIISKNTFSKTTLEIDGQRVKLSAEPA